jgi:hypothetical protein
MVLDTRPLGMRPLGMHVAMHDADRGRLVGYHLQLLHVHQT